MFDVMADMTAMRLVQVLERIANVLTWIAIGPAVAVVAGVIAFIILARIGRNMDHE